jgi:hypothetical protein
MEAPTSLLLFDKRQVKPQQCGSGANRALHPQAQAWVKENNRS